MICNTNVRSHDQRRTGLTLIELVVVLAILIALASIVIPLMPNMLSWSHDASAATNITEISKTVQTYNQLYFGFPNYLDNLVEAGGTGGGALLGTLAGGGSLAGQVKAQALTALQVTALNNIGINYVANSTGTSTTGTASWSPTFFPYTTTAPNVPADATAITAGTGGGNGPTVAGLTGTTVAGGTPTAGSGVAAAVTKLGVSPSGTYVVLGFGVANSAVGQVLQKCPVHFPDQATISPAAYYERYGLIFKVSDSALTTPMQNAVFVGVVCLLDDGIESGNDHIQDFFNLSAQKQ